MEVSLVIPVHNEAGNLERVVERVRSTLGANSEYVIEIVLVNDNSTDRTGTICDDLANRYPEVSVVHRSTNPGFGNAIKAGLEDASGDVIVPLMGDLSDDPADVLDLIAAIENGYDVVYGSRFVEGGTVEGYSPLKLFYNRAYNNLIRLLFGIRARDVTNAFTAYRREVIEEIGIENLNSESFDLTVELPLRAHIHGFRSTEVPVSWRSRETGVSKLNATRKGPLYLKRLLHMFGYGNLDGLRDIFGAIASGSPFRIVGAALVGVLILVGLFSVSGFGEVFTILRQTNVAWLLVGAGAYLISFFVRTWRYRVLLRTSGHLASRGGVFRSIMTGWFVNFLLPARAGDVARGVALKTTEEVPFGVATGLVIVERILDMLVLGGTMVVVAAVFLRTQQASYLAVGALAIAVVLAGVLLAVYLLDEQVAALFAERLPEVRKGIAELNRALVRTAQNPYAMAWAFLLSLPIWALEASTIFFSAQAVGLDISVVATVTTAMAAFVAQAVPVTPAGIGTYEATITAVLSLFAVPASSATALALVDHFVRVALVYVVGAISTVHIGFRSRAYFRENADAVSDRETESAPAQQD